MKLRCAVAFCKGWSEKWAQRGCTEYLCGKHYRLVDKSIRKKHNQHMKNFDTPSPFWRECVEQAVTRAGMEP